MIELAGTVRLASSLQWRNGLSVYGGEPRAVELKSRIKSYLWPRSGWRRAGLFTCGAITVFAAAAGASQKPSGTNQEIRKVRVTAQPVGSFLKSGAETRQFGSLRFRGGLVLDADDKAFGGYSGLEISPDGKAFMAVSDAGTWMRAELVTARGVPAGIVRARIGPLLALRGRRLVRAKDRDAEALRLIKGTLTDGIALVAFERNQRIGTFKIANGELRAPVGYLRPPRRLPFNKGLEAAALITSGTFKGSVLAFAERSIDANGHHRGWIWVKGKARAIALTDVGGFNVTDIAFGPDGALYVLERRFRWSEGVKMRIRRIESAAVKPGALLDGRVLMRADMRHEIDNMEGLALHRDRRGSLILTLISDDNFNSFLQRTLLLQFEVIDQKRKRPKS